MKIGFLITARLKSSRLKLKLLKPLHGRNVIERIIDRAKSVTECDDIVLCTSNANQDLPLVRTAVENDIYYYNGSREDVLQRLLEATELFNFDYFIGITADNPLFSVYHANLLSDMIRTNPDIDYMYTTGMPIGVNMYAIKTKALQTVCEFKEEVDTEIWGYLINRPEIFNVVELPVSEEYKINRIDRMTLDYLEDYHFFRNVFKSFDKGEVVEILDVYDLLLAHPDICDINAHIKQLDLEEEVKKRISDFFEKNVTKVLDMKKRIYNQK